MRKTSLLLTLLMILQLLPTECFKAYANEQNPPTHLAVAEEDGQPVISYSPEKGYYAKLQWIVPSSWGGDEQHYEMHYRAENDDIFQVYGGVINKDQTEIEIQNLKSGTVYYVHLVAIHEHNQIGQPVTTDEAQSNEIMFVTDTNISVEPGINETLDIKWDNVIYNSASVSYDVYISESSSFAETSPIHVSSADIGVGKAVQVAGTKLVYNSVDLKPGTIYYVKIRTIVDDDRVTCLFVSALAAGYTNIRTEINKVSSDWWRLEWSAITNTNLGGDDEILYKIIRSVDGDLEKEIAGTKDTSLLVKGPTDNTYFKIQADLVSQLGSTITVLSGKVYATEEESIATPPVPQILDDPSEQHTEIGSDNITLLWEAPYTTTGELDTDVSYDIWILKNSADIDNESISPTVANLKVGVADFVYEKIGNNTGDRIIGFKHTLSNLDSNTVYYLKMVAKKTYTINNSTSTAISDPALKVFVTLPDGAIDQPVIPSVPPFKVKTSLINGKEADVTTSNAVTLQWKNQWYEAWDDTNSKWIYLADDEVAAAAVAGEVYRLITYDPDIKFSVGYEVYTNNFDFSRLMEITSPMPTQIIDIPNNNSSTTVEYTVNGLESNTSYVMWMRAYRSDSLQSHLSDPIIISTRPNYEVPLHKPTIPEISYQFKGDTYIDLGWSVIDDYYYDIRYGTQDDNTKITDTIEIKPGDMGITNKYKIEGLSADTIYYFWIKARVKGANNQEQSSDWSNSYLIKTAAYTPPEPPTGFGIKNTEEPVGMNYIYYEWVKLDGLEYTIEVAKKQDFSDAVSYPSKDISEYKIEKLQPNTRYYARIYAYDPNKKLRSENSPTISVKTLKSNDEYDTGVDTETPAVEVPKPEFDENDEDVAVLNVKYEKTDMFIEQIYLTQGTDFIINFEGLNPEETSKTKRAEGVEASKTRISPRILVALEQKKQNLVLNNGPVALIVKPGIMQNKQLLEKFRSNPDCMMELTLQKISNPTNKTSGSSYVSEVWQVSIELATNAGKTKLTSIEGLKVRVPYYDSKWFDKTTMTGAIYDAVSQLWSRVETVSAFDALNTEGTIYFNVPGSITFAVMKMAGGKFSDVSNGSYANEIKAITGKYNLKCLGNGLFEPSKMVVKSEAVKILLDILNYNYDEDYLSPAQKAGIITNINMVDQTKNATKEEAAAMIVRVYELVTGNKAASSVSLTKYYDGKTVDKNLSAKVAFALENKIIDTSGGLIGPKDSFTRGQMMVMIKNMLEKAGIM